MTTSMITTAYDPPTEAFDVAQRFAAALAQLRGEPLEGRSRDHNVFILSRTGLCVTSMAGGHPSSSFARLDRLVLTHGVDALMVRIFLTRSSKQVAFDVLLREGARTEAFPDLRLLIDPEGAFWLIPGSPKGQGLMAGRSGFLPVTEASAFRGAARQRGLEAGLRLLAGEAA